MCLEYFEVAQKVFFLSSLKLLTGSEGIYKDLHDLK